ncbi:hypothetical protein AAW51_0054 [Caldimonas brevitalea]|uniref:C-type lysozyme inhibitor domain-containing protein n=1 Tax=Caldimonas brevitalea TaxID=413882 RepID=A0A0G3BJM6_9BURK|nr:hypothetical protein AAW51_0054 [Caldimonas brevitalea]
MASAAVMAAPLTPPPSWRMSYRCDDGSRLVASFDHAGAPSRAWVSRLDQRWELPSLDSAEGALFGDGRRRLRTRGNEAWLEEGDGPSLTCRGEAAPQRLMIDREAGVRLALPPSWLPDRYVVLAVRGEEAAVLQPGAESVYVVEYQPQAAGLRSAPLLVLAVLPRRAGSDGRTAAVPRQAPLAATEERLYFGRLPGEQPYPPGSPDAQTLEVMRAALERTPHGLRDWFSLLGEPEGPQGRLSVALGLPAGARWRQGDEVEVQLLDLTQSETASVPQRLGRARATATSAAWPPRLLLPFESERIETGRPYALTARVLRNGRLVYAGESTRIPLARPAAKVALTLVSVRGDAGPTESGWLYCSGVDKRGPWRLQIGDLSSRLAWPGQRGATPAARGQWHRLDAEQPPVAVWRGGGDRDGPVVAMVREDSCADRAADLLPSTHRAWVSLPAGRVLQGCCR